eukprot:COSAG06_NODE_32486_length_505_cov_1.066502_1_plen_65_part_10
MSINSNRVSEMARAGSAGSSVSAGGARCWRAETGAPNAGVARQRPRRLTRAARPSQMQHRLAFYH